MDHDHHAAHSRHATDGSAGETTARARTLNRIALLATLHCLAGCAVGEIAGMLLGTSLGWSNGATVAVSIVLSFASGYALTLRPLRRSGIPIGTSLRLAFASDTLSIAIMEVIDNCLMLVVPGAMSAPITAPLFWWSLGLSLLLAGAAAFPANRWLIARGRGHALVRGHGHGHA
jgi:hypothetical protein